MCRSYVAYYRVSTAKQGKSGLGLEAQQAAAHAFIAERGKDAKLLSSFTEVESGKRADRPELRRAMEHARLTGSTLLIAKLDRLSRDVHFLTGLQNAGVHFVAADMPEANEMVVQMMAVMAEAERKAISHRTKAALQAAKARGMKLGNPNGAKHLRQYGHTLGLDALRQKADERAKDLAGKIAELEAQGITSANAIAKELNAQSIQTPRSGKRKETSRPDAKWTARSVINLRDRLKALA